MSLANLIKVGKRIDFGTLYIKPAFVFIDDSGHIKLQFEMDPNSAMAYLYGNLCKELGIAWNYDTPYNKEGVYTNCAMHASGDRAKYGCGPEGSGIGGFCPQMTVAYSARFQRPHWSRRPEFEGLPARLLPGLLSTLLSGLPPLPLIFLRFFREYLG